MVIVTQKKVRLAFYLTKYQKNKLLNNDRGGRRRGERRRGRGRERGWPNVAVETECNYNGGLGRGWA